MAEQIWSSDLSARIPDHLCQDIGPHPVGTVAMNRAVNFVQQLMNETASVTATT